MRKQATLVAAISVVAILSIGGAVYAAIPDANGVIHGCYNTRGLLRVIDDSQTTCGAGETPLNWNVKGQPGPQGPTGPQGSIGPQGPAGDSGLPQVFFEAGSGTSSVASPNGVGGPFELDIASVPAGAYVAEAQISAFDFPSTLTCSIEGTASRTLKLFRDPAAPLGSDTTIFGTLDITNAFNHTGGPVGLTCSTVGPGGLVEGPRTNIDATLTVTKVASVG